MCYLKNGEVEEYAVHVEAYGAVLPLLQTDGKYCWPVITSVEDLPWYWKEQEGGNFGYTCIWIKDGERYPLSETELLYQKFGIAGAMISTLTPRLMQRWYQIGVHCWPFRAEANPFSTSNLSEWCTVPSPGMSKSEKGRAQESLWATLATLSVLGELEPVVPEWLYFSKEQWGFGGVHKVLFY